MSLEEQSGVQHSTVPVMESSLTFDLNQIQLTFKLDLHLQEMDLWYEFGDPTSKL